MTRTPAWPSSRSRSFSSTKCGWRPSCSRTTRIVWTQALLLDGELQKAEPKRLRDRLLHVAGRLAFSGRRARLHLQHTWPRIDELLLAFRKLKTLGVAAG
jgi:hypothetical protein